MKRIITRLAVAFGLLFSLFGPVALATGFLDTPASAASCSGGWFNAQYPVGSASVSAVGSCGSGAIGYPYASHPSPVTNICVQWFNNFDQWQSMGCTAIQNNAPPTYAVASYHPGSWRTVVTGGVGNRYSATVTL